MTFHTTLNLKLIFLLLYWTMTRSTENDMRGSIYKKPCGDDSLPVSPLNNLLFETRARSRLDCVVHCRSYPQCVIAIYSTYDDYDTPNCQLYEEEQVDCQPYSSNATLRSCMRIQVYWSFQSYFSYHSRYLTKRQWIGEAGEVMMTKKIDEDFATNLLVTVRWLNKFAGCDSDCKMRAVDD